MLRLKWFVFVFVVPVRSYAFPELVKERFFYDRHPPPPPGQSLSRSIHKEHSVMGRYGIVRIVPIIVLTKKEKRSSSIYSCLFFENIDPIVCMAAHILYIKRVLEGSRTYSDYE